MGGRTLCFVFGTRPEIIKLGPLIRLCREERVPFFCIHTGQHYSRAMDEVFFEELGLPMPRYRLSIRSKAPHRQGDHTGRMLIEIEKILLDRFPFCVVVQGDTNTAFAGALTAEKISTTESFMGYHIRVAHVEAGLRSYDRSMPEETNRFIADHLSDFLFVPTAEERKILLREGVPRAAIHVTGNTIVDAVRQSIPAAERRSRILETLRLPPGSYLLLTLHRQENVDSREVFAGILEGLSMAMRALGRPIVFPMHPRTAKMVERFGVAMPEGVRVLPPLGFLDFLRLEANAAMVFTDSGGVQEETCILGVPCVTLRTSTERPETVAVGSNVVAGTAPRGIVRAARRMAGARRRWRNPFGDGRSARRMLEILRRE
ncbi:MAG: UDP-N-acetylglucosamine 2-epimerase (non-hydrolyzing) [bacterium]|nr:UDP-N-acetylglucosamine 2-epimerase (non-hydrolyzing) [bacterium]